MSLAQERAQLLVEQNTQASLRWLNHSPTRHDIAANLQKGGAALAESPQRLAQNLLRESLRPRAVIPGPILDPLLERIIGPTIDFEDFPPSSAGYQAGLPVARMVILAGDGIEPEGFGTGFLVAPGILLTNHHVLAAPAWAHQIGAQFRFEKTAQGIRRGELFELDPDRFFLTSKALDFSFVAVKPSSAANLDAYGFAPLIEATGKILLGEPIQIIQHPSGLTKKYALRDNLLVDILDNFLHYRTDTQRGSSGSPAFNTHWELVALHHSGIGPMINGRVVTRDGRIYDPKTMPDTDVDWIANEGIRVSVIVSALRAALATLPANQAKILNTVLAQTVDPIESGLGSTQTSIGVTSNPMSNNTFNFTGPVTIFIGSTPSTTIQIPAPQATIKPTDTQEGISIDPNYSNRPGYKEDFLSLNLPLPSLDEAAQQVASSVLSYHHFSIVMNKVRRLAIYTAVNIDGRFSKRPARSADKWYFDPRLEKKFQLGEFLYASNPLDRGHLVRRLDPAWGTTKIAKVGNDDTFHFTNCSPQHANLNQQIWNDLEDYLLDNADQDNLKLTVFTGPIFESDDPIYREVPLPRRFWKVAAMIDSSGAFLAAGFIQSHESMIQDLLEADFLAQQTRTDQVKISDIEALTGLGFNLPLSADPLNVSDGTEESLGSLSVRRLERLEDIRLR